MPITDLVAPEAILPALKVNSKKQALQELAAKAAELTGQNERAVFEVLFPPNLEGFARMTDEELSAMLAAMELDAEREEAVRGAVAKLLVELGGLLHELRALGVPVNVVVRPSWPAMVSVASRK